MSKRRKSFFINGIMLTAVALAMRAVGIAFNSYVTRTVGAEGIGLYTLIMTVYSFAVTFATSGINLTVTRLVATAVGDGEEGKIGRIMRHAVGYCLIFSVSAAVVLFVLAPYFGRAALGDARTIIPMRILAASLIPISICSAISGYFVGVKRVVRNAIVQVFAQALKIGITLFFVFRFIRLGVEYAIIALAISTTLTELSVFLVALLQYLLDRRRARKSDRAGVAHFSDVASVALPLALSAYVRSALLTLEHILIPKRLRDGGESHSDALSQYGILHGMALPLLTFPMSPLSSFAGLLVPEFAEGMARAEWQRLKRIAGEALDTTLTYASLVSVLISVFSEELGYVVYGSYGAGRYVAFLAPVIPIMYLDHVTDSMLKGVGEHVFSMWVNIADSLLSVVLVWVLIPVMGIYGYAVVIVVMEVFNFVLSAIRLHKVIPFRIHFAASLLLPLASALLSALITRALFVMSGADSGALWLILKLVFSLCVFFAVYIPISSFFGANKKRRGGEKRLV